MLPIEGERFKRGDVMDPTFPLVLRREIVEKTRHDYLTQREEFTKSQLRYLEATRTGRIVLAYHEASGKLTGALSPDYLKGALLMNRVLLNQQQLTSKPLPLTDNSVATVTLKETKQYLGDEENTTQKLIKLWQRWEDVKNRQPVLKVFEEEPLGAARVLEIIGILDNLMFWCTAVQIETVKRQNEIQAKQIEHLKTDAVLTPAQIYRRKLLHVYENKSE